MQEFGYVKGAFTGAVSDEPGLFKVADGGTLFLDEIGELPLDAQAKVLRALADDRPEIRPVGGKKAVPINVRVIAATNRNLLEEVRRGTFREDLYYRLAVGKVRVPSLVNEVQARFLILPKHCLRTSTQRWQNRPRSEVQPTLIKFLAMKPCVSSVHTTGQVTSESCGILAPCGDSHNR